MFKHQGVWLPDGEKHFPEWMSKNGELVDGRGTYQIRKLRAALEHCKRFRLALDVGGHVGLWTMQLLKRFHYVHAFEPVADYRECFKRNVSDTSVMLHDCALGAAPGRVAMVIPPLDGGIDSGGTHVGGLGEIELRTLDSFRFENVDFIKIDCEGFEHHVIEGARETLREWKPCVIVEQKQRKLSENFGITGTPAVDILKTLGYVARIALSGDYIMTVG